MKQLELSGKVALVTGASSGLGVDFARQLAARGANLVLVARREQQLSTVAADIVKTYGVSVQTVVMDLGATGAPQVLFDQLLDQAVHVDVLVNNAGSGIYGDFVAAPWESEKAMLDIDIVALTHMTKLFARDMLARKSGYILQVSSFGAYQPSPTYATYSAAKAYVLMMGEALNYELRNSGVSVTVVSPGVTATEFLKVAGQSTTLFQRLTMMDSPTVARIGIDSMLRRQASVIPGFLNSLSIFCIRLLPSRLQAAIVDIAMTFK
jgi:short-subunit dehydrogenase